MFYKQNNTYKLDDKLFFSPTCEYRATPFWAWNSTLDKCELNEQIDIFKKMGFGGFHMHVRQGLETPYMGNEFLDAVSFCIGKAKSSEMLAWLYDEDRWPSGCAGGKVTSEIKHRLRYLLMTSEPEQKYTLDKNKALYEGIPLLLGVFSVNVDDCGVMTDYSQISQNDTATDKRYFYCMTKPGGEPRFNYQSYSDNLSRECVEKFIGLTHEKYKRNFSNEFGKTVPAIFTDEPQCTQCTRLPNGHSKNPATLSFTLDLPEDFKRQNGYGITERLPELFFACEGEQAKKTRYDYNKYISERFCSTYADTIGKWCQNNGIMMTGHALGEDTLDEMLRDSYEPMRFYKEMQLPGIDVLFDDRCFTTALQCRSAVRQLGREGMLSELYGVTGWDFDFRGHKLQGDWQACLGVTVRVPHLAWQTMKGEGKRDYPASISYQSPWYKEYGYLEDHFARINTALTRGKPCVRVAVIHPLESAWLDRASNAETKASISELDERFHTLASWLLDGTVEFDYISQSLLSELCQTGSAPLKVGLCSYDTVIASDCITLRDYTVKILEEFKNSGGNLIFTGLLPTHCDGVPSEKAKNTVFGAKAVPFSRLAILRELENVRTVSLNTENGDSHGYMHTLRDDNGRKWLFLAKTEKPELAHTVTKKPLTVTVKGEYTPSLYDTLSGEIKAVSYRIKNGKTELYITAYDYDSFLFALDEKTKDEYIPTCTKIVCAEREFPYICDYALSEPNVLLLDTARYSVNGGDFSAEEEIMRIDEAVRKKLGLTSRRSKVVQPYVIDGVPEENILSLRFTIMSEAEASDTLLALENADKCDITFNGEPISNECIGYYVDKHINTVRLGKIKKGENLLSVSMPFGLRTDLEAMYLLGDFGTKQIGRRAFITEKPQKLYFGNAVGQGLDFYGGNITYKTEIYLESDGDYEIELTNYRGALVKITLDGDRSQRLVFSPYKVIFNGLSAGFHTFDFTVYGNRYNTFSGLHCLVADRKRVYIGPDYWRTRNDAWAYEYQLRPSGILKTPIIRRIKLQES